jgi:hypothetical protein
MNININPNFTAMVTGHGKTRAYLQQFRLTDNAKYHCRKEDETVDHLIYRCTLLHAEERDTQDKRPTHLGATLRASRN